MTLDSSALGFEAMIDVVVRAVDARFERRLLGDSADKNIPLDIRGHSSHTVILC